MISWLFKTYQWFFAPLFMGLGAQCRFYPSCSAYAQGAWQKYPWPKAFALSLKRVLRCHPGQEGGIDLP